MSGMALCGRVRRSRRSRLRSLEELSLAESLHHVLPLLEPDSALLDTLSRYAMGLLAEAHRLEALPRGEELRTLQYRQYCTPHSLIGWNSLAVFLETFGWEEERMRTLLNRIVERCKGGLQRLEVRYCPVEGRAALTELLPRLQGLTHLRVDGELADDTLLEAVTTLRNLRDLSVASSGVSDVGLHHVAATSRRLEVLRVSSCHHVTRRGLACLLASLPRLLVLKHPELPAAILDHARIYPGQTVPLRGSVRFSLHASPLEVLTVLRTAPLLTSLNFEHGLPAHTPLDTLRLATHATRIHLRLREPPAGFTHDLVSHFHLTQLHLHSEERDVDISVIAQCCPDLTDLHYQCFSAARLRHSMEGTFTRLQSVSIFEQSLHAFPTPALRAVCEAPLQSASFRNTQTLNDAFCTELFALVSPVSPLLAELTSLALYELHELRLASVQGLLHLCPALTTLVLAGCRNLQQQEVTSLVNLIAELELQDLDLVVAD